MMIDTLEALACEYPAMRRYAAQGFELVRPVLALELEFDIETINQTLRVNATGTDVRAVRNLAIS